MGISPYHIDQGPWTLLRALEHRRYLMARRPGLVPACLVAGQLHGQRADGCDQIRRVPQPGDVNQSRSILARIGPAIWPYQAIPTDLSSPCPIPGPDNPPVTFSGDMPYTPHRMAAGLHPQKPACANADKVGRVLDVLA